MSPVRAAPDVGMTGFLDHLLRRPSDARAAKRATRTAEFKTRPGNRYWWFHQQEHSYDPPLFSFLTDEEWDVLCRWYDETDRSNAAGEANVPALSMLQAIVMGNDVRNLVQLGHYEGFSTLLLGFMFRRMGRRHALFSIDIDAEVSAFTRRWVEEAGLADYIHVAVGSSTDPRFPPECRDYFDLGIQMIFIDSSHSYAHTIKELDLWYDNVEPFGLIALHDASRFAAKFDTSKTGGVIQALEDWTKRRNVPGFALNGEAFEGIRAEEIVYMDACGFGIIQRRSKG